jgi:acyl carrier protein
MSDGRDARILQAVHQAVDDLNRQLPPSRRLAKSPATVLLGDAGFLDSLGFVSLIAATQQRIEEALGARITLMDGTLLAGPDGGAVTLGQFIERVEKSLDASRHG